MAGHSNPRYVEELKIHQQKRNQKNKIRGIIFDKLYKILYQNFSHLNLNSKILIPANGIVLRESIVFLVIFGEKTPESLFTQIKLFVSKISSRQIQCSTVEKNTIQFSITEDHLGSFKMKFEEISFENFSINLQLEKANNEIKKINSNTNPALKENAAPEQEIVATSEIQNLKQTEMTAQPQENTDTNQTPSTLSELFVWVELFYFTRGYQEGKHYQSLKIDEKNNRINLKANTPVLREKMQELIEMQDEVNLKVGKVSDAATTKRFWIFLPEKTFVPTVPTVITEQKSAPSKALEEERLNALKQAVSLYLKNAKEVNTTNDYSGITVNLSQKMVVISGRNILSTKKIHRLLSKDFKLLPLISGSKSVKVKKQIEKTAEEGTNSSKEKTVYEQNSFEFLQKEIKFVLNESPFKYGENFASVLAHSKYVTVNCISENEAEQICKFLDEKGYNCKQSSARKKQGVLVYGKKVAGSVKVDLSDANLPNLESDPEPKAVEVKATTDRTPQNMAETAINAIAAMLQRCEQIEKNSVAVLGLSYDVLCVKGGNTPYSFFIRRWN